MFSSINYVTLTKWFYFLLSFSSNIEILSFMEEDEILTMLQKDKYSHKRPADFSRKKKKEKKLGLCVCNICPSQQSLGEPPARPPLRLGRLWGSFQLVVFSARGGKAFLRVT